MIVPVIVEVHTSDCWRVAIECMGALTGVSIPHFKGAVSRATDDDVTGHLRWPHATRVTHQCPQALQRINKSNVKWIRYPPHNYSTEQL